MSSMRDISDAKSVYFHSTIYVETEYASILSIFVVHDHFEKCIGEWSGNRINENIIE